MLEGLNKAEKGSLVLEGLKWFQRAHWCSKGSKGLNKAQKVSLGLEGLIGARRAYMVSKGSLCSKSSKGLIGPRTARWCSNSNAIRLKRAYRVSL